MVKDVSFGIHVASLRFAMKRAILTATNVVCFTLRLFFVIHFYSEVNNLIIPYLSLFKTRGEKKNFSSILLVAT